jgi:exopolyphosphatase / guanosine-5'-triphosphate,3'-diphosphate pyrophosphatase
LNGVAGLTWSLVQHRLPPLSQITPHPVKLDALSAAGAHDVYAALDLGTNNCRLLVARGTVEGFRVIDAFSRIVRLGEGLAASGVLSEPAMARTIDALKICADKVTQRRVTSARYVATEACRRAANCAAFLARVEAETGIPIEIISSDEEARLVVSGCAALLDREVPLAIVIDIGGGSTELAWLTLERGRPPHILAATSVPHGVVTVTDRYGGREVSEATYDAMVAEMRGAIRPFDDQHGIAAAVAKGGVQMLGSSGTVTTLGGVYLKLSRYNRAQVDGLTLSFADIAGMSRMLARMPYAERTANGCIGPDRADLVISGCAILEAICQAWPVGRLRVADRGIREGVLADLIKARH